MVMGNDENIIDTIITSLMQQKLLQNQRFLKDTNIEFPQYQSPHPKKLQ